MSNQVYVTPTKFENVRTGEVTYGVRIYDNYEMSYQNHWDAIPDDDMDVLVEAIEYADDIAKSIFGSVTENKKGVYIGNEWYDYEEIEHIL